VFLPCRLFSHTTRASLTTAQLAAGRSTR